MAHLQKSVATLRIFGDDLIPAEVTAMLGGEPTLAGAKGQVIVMRSGRTRIARCGRWDLQASDAEPENLDAQVLEIFGKLTNDLAVWHALSERFSIDLFCGWFMKEGNEGVSVSPSTLQALGERRIVLSLDIYAPTDEEA